MVLEIKKIQSDLHWSNWPRKYSQEEFEKIRNEILNEISNLTKKSSIYQQGSISKLGISDLDLFLVPSQESQKFLDNLINYGNNLSSEKKYFLNHLPFIIPKESLSQLQELWPALNCKKVWGDEKDEIKFNKIPNWENHILTTVEVIVFINFLQDFIKPYLLQSLDVRETLLRLKSLTYSIKILKLNNISKKTWEAFVKDITTLRSEWFNLDEKEQKEKIVKLNSEGLIIQLELINELKKIINNFVSYKFEKNLENQIFGILDSRIFFVSNWSPEFFFKNVDKLGKEEQNLIFTLPVEFLPIFVFYKSKGGILNDILKNRLLHKIDPRKIVSSNELSSRMVLLEKIFSETKQIGFEKAVLPLGIFDFKPPNLDAFNETLYKLLLESQKSNLDDFVNLRRWYLTFQKEFEERSTWALNLEKESNAFQSELNTKNAQIDDLQEKFYDTIFELDQIKRSILYGMARKIANGLDKLFPTSTRRGENLRLARMGYLTYKNEGLKGLTVASKAKFNKNLKQVPQTQKTKPNPFLDSKTKNFVIESLTSDFKINELLRNFLNFNSGNILELPSYPKVSIIITTLDQVALLRKNIESIKSKSTYKNYEIIIVTNNKDPNSEMRKFLETIDSKVYIYDQEYSFAGINNLGASNASGEYLVFLNDDVEVVSANWIEAFLSLGLMDSVGAVGGKLLFPDGKLQEAGCIVWKKGNAWNYGRNQNPKDPKFNYIRDVDYCSGAFLFVKKQIFDKLGGFDTRFHPAYSEDVDLCFSIRNLGYRVLFQPLACMIHHEGMTQGTNLDQGIKSYQITNQKKFVEKWHKQLDSHMDDSEENSFFERNRTKGKNILFIDHYVPEPDKDSGSQRTFRILGILSYLGNKVTFWPDNLHPSQPYTNELQQKGIEVIYGHTDFDELLKKRKNLFDIAIISRPYVSVKYIEKIRSFMPNCRIIFDTIDLHFLRMKRQQSFDKAISQADVKKMHDLELDLMKNSDLTILTSKEEAKILHDEDESLKIVLLPNIHAYEGKIIDFEERKNMIFVGGFQHPPNGDAVEFLAKEIFPLIKKELRDVKLYIIGSNPPEKIKRLSSDDIIVTGYIKDIRTFYNEAKLMLAPLRFGAGVKGKITQSLSRGLPVVTTTVGCESIDMLDGKNCMISDNPEDFAKKAVQLYSDKELWNKISQNGLQTAKNYSPELIMKLLKQVLSKITI